jgi:hypothetical protein
MQSDWTAALARLGTAGLERSGGQATVGEFVEELEAKAELRPKTFEGYAVAFRKIVEDIFEIEGGRERFDHQRGGRCPANYWGCRTKGWTSLQTRRH